MNREVQPLCIEKIDYLIKREVIKKNWLGRLVRGFNTCGAQNGVFYEIALIVSATAATVLTACVSGCLSYGTYEMTAESLFLFVDRREVSIDWGHVADFGGQVFFTYFVFLSVMDSIACEGDYAKIEQLYNKTYLEDGGVDDDVRLKTIMRNLEHVLSIYGKRCFFAKSPISVKLSTLNIAEKVVKKDFHSHQLRVQQQVREIFQQIKLRVDKETSSYSYFKRSWVGLKSIGKNLGTLAQLNALLAGVCVPSFFGAFSVCSLLGVEAIIHGLVDGEDFFADIGHVGEWTNNSLSCLYIAAKLNYWAITSHGDYEICHKVFYDAIESYKSDEVYDLLLKTVDEEVRLLASNCMYLNYFKR
ncbi:MAG: hypothetical protein VX777_04430 [Chlamydiota bacterium]|nr:hypothetical protein [Chlamydiota bacterium]